MNEQRITFTGGGTAGHVIVNIALIPEFHKKGWKINYIGSVNGIEKELIETFDYVTYHPISTGKLRRYMSLENFKDPFKILKGIFQSWNIMRKSRPNIIFSKGGFVSVPVSVAAWLRRIPIVVHESDFTPGLANKLAVPFAKRVLTTFPETVNYLPAKKTAHIGAIIRKELYEGNKDEGYRLTGFNQDKPIIMIMGGSGGSRKINEVVRANLNELLNDYQIIHICGMNEVDESIDLAGYIQYEYVKDELTHLFSVTQYIVSRAGSNAIFEFLALKLPMILIPLSRAASRGDQIVNAKSFKEQGYALVIEEEELSDEHFINCVKDLVNKSPQIINKMNKNIANNPFDETIQLIEDLSKKL